MRATPEHRSLDTTTETKMQEHVYQEQVRDVEEIKQRLIETWSAISRATLIERIINGEIVMMHFFKAKKYCVHLL